MKNETKKTFLATLLASTLVGCGMAKKSDEQTEKVAADTQATIDASMVEDEELRLEGVNAGLTDALEALADGHQSASAALSLFGASRTDNSSYERNCEAKEDQAYVSIAATIDRSHTIDNRRRKVERTVKGEGNLSRIWSLTDGQVGCDASNKYADLASLSDFSGLSVEVAFDRSRDVSYAISHKQTDRAFSSERSYRAEGSRAIRWTSQIENDDAQTIVRRLEGTSDVKRLHTRANSNGVKKEMALQVKTAADAPMVIDVERQKSDLSLESKTIVSGTLEIDRDRDGRLEASFDSLKITYSDDSCQYESGTVNFKVYKDGQIDPVKNLQFIVEAGEYKLVDLDSGEVKADFEPEHCYLKDYRLR